MLAVLLAAAHAVTWNPRLDPKTWDKPFDQPIAVRKSGQTASITDCASYLEYRGKGFEAGENRNVQLLLSRGADCRVLEALKRAKPARRSHLEGFGLDETVLQYLPPTLSLQVSRENIEAAKKAEAAGRSWKEFQPAMQVRKTKDGVTATEGDDLIRLEIEARGDFNDDGLEDVFLRADYAIIHGTYRATGLYLLTRTASGGKLKLLRQVPL